MPSPTSNSGIRDNHGRGLVGDFLQAKIKPGSRLSVVSAYFTIYAYETLKQHLDQIGHLDFLFGEPRFISSLDPEKTEGEDPNSDLSAYSEEQRLYHSALLIEAGWFTEKSSWTTAARPLQRSGSV